MIEKYLVLAARIAQEVDDIEKIVLRAQAAADRAFQRPEDQDFYFDSVALNLHDFYAGIERILKLIAASVDGNIPASGEWHRDLLLQMSVDLPDLRPPVLTKAVAESLEEYLRFRHVVRNLYTFALKPDQLALLAKNAMPVFKDFKQELTIFAQFLNQVGHL